MQRKRIKNCVVTLNCATVLRIASGSHMMSEYELLLTITRVSINLECILIFRLFVGLKLYTSTIISRLGWHSYKLMPSRYFRTASYKEVYFKPSCAYHAIYWQRNRLSPLLLWNCSAPLVCLFVETPEPI